MNNIKPPSSKNSFVNLLRGLKMTFLGSFQSTEAANLNISSDETTIVMIGRSNVGKSTLLNALFGMNLAKTSQKPGKTISLNLFKSKTKSPIALVDLPGYGHAQVSKSMKIKWAREIPNFLSSLNENDLILWIQDARHPFLENDMMTKDFLDTLSCQVILIFNKNDKIKRQADRHKVSKFVEQILSTLHKSFLVYWVSAEKKTRLEQLCKVIYTIATPKIKND